MGRLTVSEVWKHARKVMLPSYMDGVMMRNIFQVCARLGKAKALGCCYLRVLAWAKAESHSKQSLNPLYIKPILTRRSLSPLLSLSRFPFSFYYQHDVQFVFSFFFSIFLIFCYAIHTERDTYMVHACMRRFTHNTRSTLGNTGNGEWDC